MKEISEGIRIKLGILMKELEMRMKNEKVLSTDFYFPVPITRRGTGYYSFYEERYSKTLESIGGVLLRISRICMYLDILSKKEALIFTNCVEGLNSELNMRLYATSSEDYGHRAIIELKN